VIEQAQATQQIVKSPQMRKTAKEVSKAVNEQGRAAREIIKAAQSTSTRRSKCAKLRTNKPRRQRDLCRPSNRCVVGAVSTARALSEQAVAGDQVSKEAVQLARQISEVSKADE
jgi:methyl-accepting chemotaxis protein